jgi:hypothetical protein
MIKDMRRYDMNILVIDGQGGQLGGQLIKSLKYNFKEINITAVGTNASATTTMLKAGANQASTGENPVIVACKKADVIIGPIGIVIADSLLGEVTERMALAIAKSNAVRILIPLNKCDNLVAGVPNLNTGALIDDAISKLNSLICSENS